MSETVESVKTEASPVEPKVEAAPKLEIKLPEKEKPATVDPLNDPKVQAEIKKIVDSARLAGIKEAEEAAKQKAEREAMAEADRLRLEKKEAEETAAAASAALKEANASLAVTSTLLHNKLSLATGTEMPFIQFQVTSLLRSNPNLSAEEATAKVLNEHPHLVKSAAETKKDESKVAEAPSVTLQAAPQKATATSASPTTATKSVMDMSKAEYAEYKRKNHGIG